MNDFWSDNDPDVIRWAAERSICFFCYADEYDHDEDCPLYYYNMLDEEVVEFLEEDED